MEAFIRWNEGINDGTVVSSKTTDLMVLSELSGHARSRQLAIYLCNGMLETSNFNSCNRQLRYFQPRLIACNSLIGYSGFARNGTTPRRKNQK